MNGCRVFPYFASLLLCVFALNFPYPIAAQKVAILTPDNAEASRNFAETLKNELDGKLKVLDDSLSESAYLSSAPTTPFNLTTVESKRIGSAIGCDAFIILRSATQRRSAYKRAEYYESYAAIYVVSSRTGRLIFWKLQQFEAPKPDKSLKMLNDSVGSFASEITTDLRTSLRNEVNEPQPLTMEEVPTENSPAAKNFRAPVPYRRIKPEYTARASLYDVAAAVEMVIDLDAEGTIQRTELVRWAGFGLDESAERAVRSMNWRPAERNGKTLPMRFLVRYNFRKVVE